MADPAQFYRWVAPRFIACGPDPLPGGLRDLLPGRDEVSVYQCRTSLQKLLRAALRESPLVLGYELAVLKRMSASNTGPERLALSWHPLFGPGEQARCSGHGPGERRADRRQGHRVRRRDP